MGAADHDDVAGRVGWLVLGFAVAQATGSPVRWGRARAGAGWCALRWRRTVSIPRPTRLVVLYVACFVASHLIADTAGTCGAMFIVAAIAGLAALLLADIPASRRATAAR